MASYTATDISWSINYPRKSVQATSMSTNSKNYQTLPKPKVISS